MCACTERYSPTFSEGIIDRTGAQTMLYLTCTTISSVDLAQYRVLLLKFGYMWNVVQNDFIIFLSNLHRNILLKKRPDRWSVNMALDEAGLKIYYNTEFMILIR